MRSKRRRNSEEDYFGLTQIVAKTKKTFSTQTARPKASRNARCSRSTARAAHGRETAPSGTMVGHARIHPRRTSSTAGKAFIFAQATPVAESTALHLDQTQRNPEEATKMIPPNPNAQLRKCAPPAKPTCARTAQCPYFETGRVSNGADWSIQLAIYVNLMFWA